MKYPFLMPFIILVNLFLYGNNLLAEEQFRLDNWEVFTSHYDVTDIDFDKSGILWAATNGGIFSYDLKTNTYTNYTDIFNILTINFNSVVCDDNSGDILFGANDGTIEILTKEKKWIHITDVKVAGFSNPTIYDMIIKDDRMFIAGGWGIAVFDLKNRVFIETVKKFGDFATNTKTNIIQFTPNSIIVGTDMGIAEADLNSTLADNRSWKNYVVTDGITTTKVNAIVDRGDTTFVAVDKYLCYLDRESKKIRFHTDVEYFINNIFIDENKKLHISTQYNLLTINPITQLIWSFDNIKTSFYHTDEITMKSSILLSITEKCIGILNGDNLDFINPNTPTSNNIGDIVINKDNHLYFTNPQGSKYPGIVSFVDGKWKTTKVSNMPINKLSLSDDYKLIGSTWGGGFNISNINDTGFVVNSYNNKNSPLTGIAQNPDWVVIGESADDNDGTIWVVNYGESSMGPVLVALDKNGQFYDFSNTINPTDRYFVSLAIDHNGTKWIGAFSNGRGLLAINENKTLGDKSDDKTKFFSNTAYPNLQSNWIRSLKVDKLGWLWIGTDAGLSVIRNTSGILTDSKIDISIHKKLISQSVNTIMIDALNNKWIGTNQGIWILNSDGSEVLSIVNTQNSPLLSDEIFSIANNPNTGEIFIGTKDGLFKASSLSVKPSEDFSMKVYPQPFNINKDYELVIEGLAADTDIKIITTSGDFIASIITQGGKAVWNGKDSNGNTVNSGIYLISAYSNTNKSNAVSKIAIINK